MKSAARIALLCACMASLGAVPARAQDPATHTSEAAALMDLARIKSDFAQLYEALKRAHFNLYENVSRAEYDRLFDQMSAEILVPETASQVARRFQRFMAFGRIAHARIDTAMEAFGRFRSAGGRFFPLLLRFDGRRAYVLENRSGSEAPPEGAEILALDGEGIGTWFDRVRQYVSADTDYLASALLEFYFPRLLWSEAGFRPSFEITYRHEGKVHSENVLARSSAEQDQVKRPHLLRLDPDGRHAGFTEPGIAYLRPGPFYNNVEGAQDMYDARAFRQFIDTSMADFVKNGARAVVIDLRENPGGDNSFSDHLLSWFAHRPFRFASDFRIKVSPETTASNAARLRVSVDPTDSASARMAALYANASNGQSVQFPVNEGRPRQGQRFRGKVYVLVDRHSYSNATSVAAVVQDYGFGTVIGEETADLATTLGAMESFTLTNIRIVVGYPKARIVRPNGSPVRRGVVPDILIKTPAVADASDPVLRQAVAIARAGRRR